MLIYREMCMHVWWCGTVGGSFVSCKNLFLGFSRIVLKIWPCVRVPEGLKNIALVGAL